jgi:hypothetical protein
VALAPAQMISAACAAVLAWVQVEIRLSLPVLSVASVIEMIRRKVPASARSNGR